MKTLEVEATVWLMWRCGNLRRWTSVKNSILVDKDDVDGGECWFSGCGDGKHKKHLIGETTDVDKAHNWFRGYQDTWK